MKHFFYLTAMIGFILLAASCKKENTPTLVLNEKVDPAFSKPATNNASFGNGPYGTASGNARMYLTENRYQLALEDFMSSNGPNLMIYLSKELNPSNFVNLGPLKSTTGNQLYNIPVNVDVKEYTYVLVYCERYAHLFGQAKLSY